MFRKLGLVGAAFALFSIAGGQWAVLQTAAWAGMLHDYAARSGSVTLAIEQTFDGEHPCALCRQIADAKARQHQDKPVTSGARDDAKIKARLADSILPALALTSEHISFLRAVYAPGADRADQPPTPPPRRGTLAA